MLRAVLIASSTMFAVPILACPHFDDGGSFLEFIDDGENTVVWHHASTGRFEICNWARTDEGSGHVLLCDHGKREFFESGPSGIEMGGRSWRNYCIGSMQWSQTFVPPHGNSAMWAAGYPLQPDSDYDGPIVQRWEWLSNVILFDHALDFMGEASYDFTLVTLEHESEAWQELELIFNSGGDGYPLLRRRFDDAPFAKIYAEGDRLLALEAKGGEGAEIHWLPLARNYVRATYRNADAWEGVLAGEGPVPWTQVKVRFDLHAALLDICQSGTGEELAGDYRQDVCLQLPMIEDELKTYGYCRTDPDAALPFDWCTD